MLAQVERLGRLVTQLLDLSRLESGAVPLERRSSRSSRCSPTRCASSSCTRPRSRCSVSVEAQDLTADGDPERVHQVVANLLENAVRHSPAAVGRGARARRNDRGVTIEVIDEGPGIPEADAARVFERFYRADSARASSDGGAGLGLAIAQWIVDLHGGDIHPERREPHGCRMVVTLPHHSDSSLRRQRCHCATVDEALKRIRRGEMVLVVDDEDRENEGDLTMAASGSPATRSTSCCGGRAGSCACRATPSRLDGLDLWPMVPPGRAGCDTPFTVSIDHVERGQRHRRGRPGHHDPAVLDGARPTDFLRPGHVFPLRARPGGVLERRGHTEAAVDLARLAGLPPVAVICEVLHDDGSPARLPFLELFARSTGSRWCPSTRSSSTGWRTTTPRRRLAPPLLL